MYMEDKDWSIISPYFKKEEFACKHCGGYGKGIAKSLVIAANHIRARYGKPTYLTSPYRCKEYNDSLTGSVPNSKHIEGLAIDFTFDGINTSEVVEYCKRLPFYNYAYTNNTNMKGAVHLDVKLIDFGTNEIIKEVIVEKPIEVIKEVIIEKPIEVIKEVPIEIIIEKPIEIIKEVIKEIPVEVEKEYSILELFQKILKNIFKR